MSNTVIFVGDDCLGRGDDELGRVLMLSAIGSVGKLPGERPTHILFMNNGVKLCCDGSPALDALGALADAGVDLLCCGTCLDWFDLTDALVAGRVSNMVEILGLQAGADRVIRL